MNPADPAGAAVLEAARRIAAGDSAGAAPARRAARTELAFAGFACLEPDDGDAPAARRLLSRVRRSLVRDLASARGADAARRSFALRPGRGRRDRSERRRRRSWPRSNASSGRAS